MIRRLGPADAPTAARDADVLVVGAGIVGLVLATKLARAGKRVIVLESGEERQDREIHPLNEVRHGRSVYSGALHGRARCLGGTSTLWGGALIPFQPADMSREEWPISLDELAGYVPELERIFGLNAGSYDVEGLADRLDGAPTAHLARLAKWPPFKRRNVATLFAGELHAASGPEVWLDATATRFAFDEGGRCAAVEASATDGPCLRVRAPQVVLAAGAIESTRLLLLADRQHGGRIFGDDVLGRYFGDHLSVRVGRVIPIDRPALNRVVGFRFEKGATMRNLRFEPSPTPEVRREIPPGFAHVAFPDVEGGGFDSLRALFRTLQQGKPPRLATLLRLARHAPWLARAVWWRFVEHRLLYPAGTIPELHMVVEQKPLARNRIGLAEEHVDRFGLPMALIDWAPSEADVQALVRSTELFLDTWSSSALARLASIERRPDREAVADLAEGGGIYHPTGSTRMGRSAADGVVDARLRCFRVPNLYVAATSVFPAAGGANPTMTLLLASLRLADELIAA